MDAHMSLVTRVASLESILRQDEMTMTTVLQRLKKLEEHVAATEARRGSDDVSDRVGRALEGQSGQVEALRRRGAAAELAEERLSGAVRAMEQRVSGEAAGFHQRLQALELSAAAAARGVDAALQAQAAKAQSAEQQLRGDLQAAQQRLLAEVAAARQRTDAVDAALRASIAEAHRSLAADLSGLSDAVKAQMQSVAQQSDAAVAAVEQQVLAEAQAAQQNAAAQKQRADAQEAATRESLHALHGSVTADLNAIATRTQAIDGAWQAADQQRVAEINALRQQIEVSEANWRTGVNDLNGHINTAVQGVRTEARAAESAAATRIAHTERRADELQGEIRKAIEAVAHSLGGRIAPLERLREDAIEMHASLRVTRDDLLRLREDMKSFPFLLETEKTKLRGLIEVSVRASHGDMLERLKPLSSYRNELHTAIGAAVTKLWSEANGTFVIREDMKTLQKQINVLNNALHNEVTLLAEKNRELEQCTRDEVRQRERKSEETTDSFRRPAKKKNPVKNFSRASLDSVSVGTQSMDPSSPTRELSSEKELVGNARVLVSPGRNASTALNTEMAALPAGDKELISRLLDAETGALCPVSMVDELKSLWAEVRVVQQRGGMSRDDVMENISECRRYILDVALADARRSEDEFRAIILQIEKAVQNLSIVLPEGGALMTKPLSALTPQVNGKRKPKKTVIRVVPRGTNDDHYEEGDDADKVKDTPGALALPPLIKIRPSGEATDAVVACENDVMNVDCTEAVEKLASPASPEST